MADLKFDEYELFVRDLSTYPHAGCGDYHALTYTTMALAGEAGECADEMKKVMRDGFGTTESELSTERRAKLVRELGDVLWYITATAGELGFTLEEIARENVRKLDERIEKLALEGDSGARRASLRRRQRGYRL